MTTIPVENLAAPAASVATRPATPAAVPSTPPADPRGPVADRLRGVLRAHQLITADLSLPVVLRRIAETACDISGARFGALGVIGPEGDLEQFIHVGLDAATAARIGELPKGRGVLGLLIDHPTPIRIDDLAGHPDSSGLPPNHPPMTGFLGVPIRVRGAVYGILYLTEPAAGTFTAEDEELTTTLAATAGVAIDNARHLDEARRGQQWLRASAEITRELLGGGRTGHGDALASTVRTAQRLADADFVAVVLPTPGGRLRVTVAVGEAGEYYRHAVFDRETALGAAICDGRGRLFTDADVELVGPGETNPYRFGPVLVAPMADAAGSAGALVLTRAAGRFTFTPADLEMAATFADHVTLALQLDEARAHAERVNLLEDRDRIARDLHDHVIQRLFATGLGLEGLASGSADPEVAGRLADHITDLDETIRQIRASIFRLQQTASDDRLSVRVRLLELANSATRMLGFDPHVRFSGPIDTAVGPELAEDLVAVAREALSNIVRHADASAVEIHVRVVADRARMEVSDDGVGLPDTTGPLSGLANLRRRAERRGGSAEVVASESGGVRLVWEVPLHAPE